MNDDQLDQFGDVFINFTNGTYQWVHLKRFRLPAAVCDDRTLLRLLIAHETYGDDYAGGEPGADPARHGPYWRDQINPDSFDPAEVTSAAAHLQTWAEQYAELREDIRAELDRELYDPLQAAGNVYRLRDLGQTAFHDWGGVHNEFHELILINRATNLLTLVVAADD